MFKDQKIGVGIITCNRQKDFRRLVDSVISTDYIDEICVVKNKEFDYQCDDPSLFNDRNNTFTYHNIKEDLGVAYCKNDAIQTLLNKGCEHIFLIEDDYLIKDNLVFNEYIETAQKFNLEHLVYGRAWDTITQCYLTPLYYVEYDGKKIEIFYRLCGGFEYFTKNALQKCGLFDAANYINALDHVEHTYRMSKLGFYTPFYAFADVFDSGRFLDNIDQGTTIEHSDDLYKTRITHAFQSFTSTHKIQLNQIPIPSKEDVVNFLRKKINHGA